jgi:hypothetical protein
MSAKETAFTPSRKLEKIGELLKRGMIGPVRMTKTKAGRKMPTVATIAPGTLRLGEEGEEVALSRGDYVALPVGADGAHQLVNTSGAVLRYLCLSTVVEPDVLVYPDSGKVGLYAGSAAGAPKEEEIFAEFLRSDVGMGYYYLDGAEVGYYDGEED